MKRFLGMPALWLCAAWIAVLVAPLAGFAQENQANNQENEERFRRLNGMVEELLAAQATLQKRIASLSDELQAVREENARAASRAVRAEDLQKLATRLREIDQKREDDRRLILEEIKRLAQTPVPVPEPPAKRPKESAKEPGPTTDSAAAAAQKGYEYVVKQGDTLGAIVDAYRQSGVKVTLSQVIKANPTVNANRLLPGQKIFIPDPAAP